MLRKSVKFSFICLPFMIALGMVAAPTAAIGGIKKYIRQAIEEEKKKIHKPEIVSQAYVDRILAELEILQWSWLRYMIWVGERTWLKNTSRRRRERNRAAKQWDVNRRRYVSIETLDKSSYQNELNEIWISYHYIEVTK
jgi:hypothetical protein